MKSSSQFYKLIWISLILLISLTFCHPLLHKIRNTQQLINMYQNKLNILIKLAKQQNLTLDFDSNSTEIASKDKLDSIFKLEEQILFQIDFGLGDRLELNARYVYPGFIVTGNKIIDIKTREIKGKLKGDIISIQPFQITTRVDDKTVSITKLTQTITSTDIKMQITNQPGKWHHATKFQDIFLQFHQQNLRLTTSTQSSTHKLKSQLLYIQTIHQYKLLYITRYSYGFLNPKSMQITGQIMFDSIVETACYSKIQGMLFVLFKNHTLSLIVSDKVVGSVAVGVEVGLLQGIGLEFVARYLFVFGSYTANFNVYEVLPDYNMKHIKELTVPAFNQCKSTKNTQCKSTPIKYTHQFFKHDNQYKLLISDTQSQSKLFNINLKQSQISQQKSFPWKFVLIIICLIAVIYFRSKNKGAQNEEDSSQSERKRPSKKLKKQKQKISPEGRENESNQDYLREINSQIKRINSSKKTHEKKQS